MISSLHYKFRRWLLAGVVVSLAGASPAFAQVAEDEWYDPTDWFDGNNIEADDTYDYDWNTTNTWGTDWTANDYDADYWDDYDWSETTNETTADPGVARTYTYVLYTFPADQSQAQRDQSQGQRSTSQAQAGSQQDSSQAQAQNQQGQRSQSQRQQQGSRQDSQQMTKLTGTIEGVRNITLRRTSGATGTYTIAKVSLENNRSTIVNLGRQSQLEGINLKKGDTVQALGRRGQVADETVFVAHQLRVNGRTIDANPAFRLSSSMAQGQGQQQQQQQQSRQNQQTFSGEVESFSRVSADQNKQQHTLVNIKLENGESSVIDLGPGASVEKIDLDEGDSITVRGRQTQMAGRQVIVADLLRIDGEKAKTTAE